MLYKQTSLVRPTPPATYLNYQCYVFFSWRP